MRRFLIGFSWMAAVVGSFAGESEAPPRASPDAGGGSVVPDSHREDSGTAAVTDGSAPHEGALTVRWKPVDHSPDGAFFVAELTLRNDTASPLGASGWKL